MHFIYKEFLSTAPFGYSGRRLTLGFETLSFVTGYWLASSGLGAPADARLWFSLARPGDGRRGWSQSYFMSIKSNCISRAQTHWEQHCGLMKAAKITSQEANFRQF